MVGDRGGAMAPQQQDAQSDAGRQKGDDDVARAGVSHPRAAGYASAMPASGRRARSPAATRGVALRPGIAPDATQSVVADDPERAARSTRSGAEPTRPYRPDFSRSQ